MIIKTIMILIASGFCQASLRADIDGNGRVDIADLSILAEEWLMEEYGANLIVNGTFDSDSDWIKGPSWSIADGKAVYDGGSGGDDLLEQEIAIEPGELYEVQITISDYIGEGVGIACSMGGTAGTRQSDNGTVTEILEAGEGSTFTIAAEAGTLTFKVDSISVRKVLVQYNVYRGQDGAIDYETPVAVMMPGEDTVEIADQDLPPNTIWHYVRRAMKLCCGKESGDSPVCIVRTGPDGQPLDPAPNPPTDVTAIASAGGVIRLRWRYEPGGQAAAASEFAIYIDTLAGEPVATVPAGLSMQGQFIWDSGPFSHGQLVRLCVRAVSGEDAESINTAFVVAVADDQGPEAISGLLAEYEEVDE